MEIYGIGGTILKWFENYLTSRKQQYIQISNIKNTDLKDFFLIYVNDLQYASNLLDPIMLADDYFMQKKILKHYLILLTLHYKKLVSGLYPTNYL